MCDLEIVNFIYDFKITQIKLLKFRKQVGFKCVR